MKLGGTSSLLSLIYDDRMDVYRHTSELNEDGTTETLLEPKKVLEGVPCRLSFSNMTDYPNDLKVDSNPILMTPTIHCHPDVKLLPGDYAVVTRFFDSGEEAMVYKGLLAQPNWFSNHQEVRINIEENA